MSQDDFNLSFVQSPEEAENRFKTFENSDPLPHIPPALLNSADLSDYARITGMVYPFHEKKLKSASYEVEFLGTVHYVDENGNRRDEKLVDKKPFKLRKNSIVFVFLEAKFSLPNYIAIRFNLKITHVHRGLLLGTGPLVDPGFVGRLLIPLHNLTSEDYVLIGGKGLIWVEFTKLSPHFNWDSRARKSAANYEEFPPTKRNADFQTYFNNASHGTPAISSIPGEIKFAKESAEKAQIEAEKAGTEARNAEASIKKFTLWSGIGIGFTVLILFIAMLTLIFDAKNYVANTNTILRTEQKDLQQRIFDLEKELQATQSSLAQLRPSSSIESKK